MCDVDKNEEDEEKKKRRKKERNLTFEYLRECLKTRMKELKAPVIAAAEAALDHVLSVFEGAPNPLPLGLEGGGAQ